MLDTPMLECLKKDAKKKHELPVAKQSTPTSDPLKWIEKSFLAIFLK